MTEPALAARSREIRRDVTPWPEQSSAKKSSLLVLGQDSVDGRCSLQSRQFQTDCDTYLLESLEAVPDNFKMNRSSEKESVKLDIASALVDFQRRAISKEKETTAAVNGKKLLHCPYCSCFYVFPVTLSCGHTLCKTCILPPIGDQDSAQINCRQCGSQNFTNRLSVNVLVMQLIRNWYPLEYESEVKKLENVQRERSQGDQREVVETLSDVLKFSPFNITALKWRSHALFQMGMCERALKDADLACQLRPFLPCVFYQRGIILFAMNSYEKAALSFARCVALDSTNVVYHSEMLTSLTKLLNLDSGHDKEIFRKYVVQLNAIELTSNSSKLPSSQVDIKDINHEDAADYQDETGREFHNRINLDKTSNRAVDKSFLGKRLALKRPLQEIAARKDNCDGDDSSFSPENSRPKRLKVTSYQMQERNKEDLMCEICYSVFFQPVTTACGHTFCRACLQRSLDFRHECPYCRQYLDCQVASQTEVTSAVKEIAAIFFPDDCAERELCFAHEKECWKG